MFKSRTQKLLYNSKNTCISSEDSSDTNIHANILHSNVNRYHIHYIKHVSSDLIYKHNIKNIFNIPKIQKIVLSTTHKSIVHNRKNIVPFLASLQIISCQKLKITNARKNISFFKIRKNQTIGLKIDLRRKKMFEFLEKLTYIVLPMTRTFYGINKYCLNTHTHFVFSIGLKDILIFPELQNYFEYFNDVNGFNISVITKNSYGKSAKNCIAKINKKQKADTQLSSYSIGKTDILPVPHVDTQKLNNFKMYNFLSAFQIPTT